MEDIDKLLESSELIFRSKFDNYKFFQEAFDGEKALPVFQSIIDYNLMKILEKHYIGPRIKGIISLHRTLILCI